MKGKIWKILGGVLILGIVGYGAYILGQKNVTNKIKEVVMQSEAAGSGMPKTQETRDGVGCVRIGDTTVCPSGGGTTPLKTCNGGTCGVWVGVRLKF